MNCHYGQMPRHNWRDFWTFEHANRHLLNFWKKTFWQVTKLKNPQFLKLLRNIFYLNHYDDDVVSSSLFCVQHNQCDQIGRFMAHRTPYNACWAFFENGFIYFIFLFWQIFGNFLIDIWWLFAQTGRSLWLHNSRYTLVSMITLFWLQ